jgi:pilus assembly protein Flp/PilA
VNDRVEETMRELIRRQEGVTAIEYGLIAALIAVVIIVAVGAVGTGVNETFKSVAAAL